MRIAVWFLMISICFLSVRASASNQSNITDLEIIPIKSGINKIKHLTPDNRDGLIIKGWRDNGNAHGYNLFVVMTSPLDDRNNLNIAGVGGDSTFEDVLHDEPHTGEDYVRSVKFARGKVDGTTAVLLVTAERIFDDSSTFSFADPAHVAINIYRLIPRPDDAPFGAITFLFDPISEKHAEKLYVNSDLALFCELRLPVVSPDEMELPPKCP